MYRYLHDMVYFEVEEIKLNRFVYMAKRLQSTCVNKTLVFIFFLIGLIIYLWCKLAYLGNKTASITTTPTGNYGNQMYSTILSRNNDIIQNDMSRCKSSGSSGGSSSCSGGGDPMTNAYVPPVKCDAGGLFREKITMNIPSNSIPINVPTQHYNVQYAQVGILTKRHSNRNSDILPLMGRRTVTARNKWQYYTVSGGGNGGNLQAKLPVKVKGRSCSGDYGCDELNSGEDVYVEGFQDTFQATIYESGMFSYIPY